MKKLDVFMLKSFLGPFILTTGVSTFILLVQYLLKYFDDFVGKNLGFTVFAELLFYFSLNMLQNALPLGVLVASLMTFGNLGEHFELTAIKSAGISLLRVIRPIFIFILFLSVGAFYFNNYAIPAANLKAYSLLYDIKQTKPALDIKEGAFYNGIPDYSIKVKEKYPDGKTLKDVIIYDHTQGRGNKTIILADSSLMYTIMNDRYLKLELFNGHYFSEQAKSNSKVDQFYRTEYTKMDLVFSLSSFDLKRRKEELFQNNRQMKNIDELSHDIDSFKIEVLRQKSGVIRNTQRYFDFHLKDKERILEKGSQNRNVIVEEAEVVSASMFPLNLLTNRKDPGKPIQEKAEGIKNRTKSIKKEVLSTDSIRIAPLTKIQFGSIDIDTLSLADLDSILERNNEKKSVIYNSVLNKARNIKVNINSTRTRIYQLEKDTNLFTIERDRKYALALACVLMFMIGAPLGAIIKKGGLGVPTIIAIFFFIIYYVIGSIGEKSAKEGAMNPYLAVWMSDLALLPFGLFFLRQARIDARLFETDIYHIWIEKLRLRFVKNKKEA